MKKKPTLPSWTFQPIGVVRSIFREKFGIPRQSGMVQGATGTIELNDHPFLKQACAKLDGFSHLWVIFVFHEHGSKAWKPSIRPPRLGGSKRVGVLASRSPHRPNPIGLSVVKIESIEIPEGKGGAKIHVSGLDILDESPVLDIKPYLPYADVVANATSGWASEPIPRYEVIWSERARKDLFELHHDCGLGESVEALEALITGTLQVDPRPTSHKRRMPVGEESSDGKKFGIALEGCDVKWEIRGNQFYISNIEKMPS